MKRQKAQNNNLIENIIHGVFLIMGLITVGCVLLITVYLVISGIPAIREIGLREFLLGKVWASTAAEPKYGILPFILTSVYGTAGAMLLGVPIGFFTAVYLAKFAPRAVKNSMQAASAALPRAKPLQRSAQPKRCCGSWPSSRRCPRRPC